MQIFVAMHKRMWSNNGDKLSQQYTGSNSNITRVIESGKQGIAGKFQQMMTGVQRYIANSYFDNEKNDCIKILLNRHLCQKPYGIQNVISQSLESVKDRYEA